MDYFREEHELFRASLRDFLQREVPPILINGKKKRKFQEKFGRKWELWDILAYLIPKSMEGVI